MDLIQTIEQFAWIGWIALILIFLAIEALTLDMTFLMLGLGSGAGLAADLLGAPLWLQIVVAAIAAAVLLFALRPPLLRLLHRGEDRTPSNMAALVGLRGTVVLTVTPLAGQVKLSNGDIWTARIESGGDLTPGIPVTVTRIDGATAVVRPHLEEAP